MVQHIITTQDLLAARIDPDYFYAVLSYSSPQVEALEWDTGRTCLTIRFAGEAAALTQLIERIKAKIGRSIVNKQPQEVYAHHPERGMPGGQVWEELLRAGMVTDFGKGHVAYRGPFLDLVQRLDAGLQRIAATQQAQAVQLPNFVPLDYLKQVGTFDQYPHYLFFVSPLRGDIDTIEAFQREGVAQTEAIHHYLADPAYCLKTAACSLLYPTLAQQDFAQPSYYTMLGCCTRHEAKTATAFERLTEFQMREIVFVGDEPGAAEFQQFALDLFRDLIACFDLEACITTANDSFFVSNYSRYKLMQLLGNEKFEARLLIPATNADIACASFNHHRYFFSQRFAFSYRGEPAVTACMGFGLERLAYGILCQHGLDWPEVLERLDRFLELREVHPERRGGA